MRGEVHTMNVRKQLAFFCATLLFLQSITLSLPYAYAETEDSVDPQQVEAFRSHQPDYLQLNQPSITSEQRAEKVQAFSFVAKTFRTTAGQPVLVRFTCALPANEVLIRIPMEGQVVEEQFSNGESIEHSHGEYWVLKTSSHQTDFVLPVVFETAGQYFLMIDHDADHFYLEVENDSTVPSIQKEAGMSDEEEQVQAKNEDQPKAMSDFPPDVQPVITTEQNLYISEELIAAENERILEETLDPSNRSTSSVRNWSQFRSAWNSSRTTQIDIQAPIQFSGSIVGGDSLNTRTTSVYIFGVGSAWEINFKFTNNNLEMSGGNTTLALSNLKVYGTPESMSTIKHTGTGLITISNVSAVGSWGSVIEGQNIILRSSFHFSTSTPNSPIKVVRDGTLTISDLNSTMSMITSNFGAVNNNIKPISSSAGTRIIVNVNQLTMGTARQQPMSSWHRVNATLSGVNGSQVVNSNSDPNDFAVRYTQLFNEAWYSSLIFNGSGSGFEPPIQTGTVTAKYVDSNGNELAPSESITGNVGTSYTTRPKDIDGWTLIEVPSNASGTFTQEPITVRYVYQRTKWSLSFQASPSEGGTPKSDVDIIIQGAQTTLHANPNEGYRFVSWEILSGNGARIADETAEITTFTMGSSDIVLQANYEEEATVIPPVDPLKPEIEVDPENKPELPENQGLLSIDFISSFNFGSQVISAQDQTYYAQPQRLLNEDGTVNNTEQRPNYVQISDRRPENERNGWQLAVTQKEQFKGKENQELKGASLSLSNQQVVTPQFGTAPGLQSVPCVLIPGNRRTLLKAQGNEGTGTWIYRFGDADTQGESVALNVPKGATPKATTYSTTLIWELSTVPNN